MQLVHSAVLVNLKDELSTALTFFRENLDNPESIPQDDIITFARSAQTNNLPQYVTNKKVCLHPEKTRGILGVDANE